VPTPRATDVASTPATGQAEALRNELVTKLLADGSISSREVEAAFRAVPRHLFAPEVPLAEAYANDVIRTKRDEHGMTISSVSAPWLQAAMLEQAELRPGMRCLEIGSGGYNAALVSELVGPTGEVTTVDIDPYVTDRARQYLTGAGYGQVNVVLADAEHGVADHAPYDRIIVTVGIWDIPPSWVNQLTEGGRIVVPLRMRGLNRSVSFVRNGPQLVSLNHQMAGFVAVQGAGARRDRRQPAGRRRRTAAGSAAAAGRSVVGCAVRRHGTVRRPVPVAGDLPYRLLSADAGADRCRPASGRPVLTDGHANASGREQLRLPRVPRDRSGHV
jgi:methyltransferase of FxLD system